MPQWSWKSKNKKVQLVNASVLGLLLFFCNFTAFEGTSPFETAAAKQKSKFRLPANIIQQSFAFDCSTAPAEMEVSTTFETIRLEASHCQPSLQFQKDKQEGAFVMFPMNAEKLASEYTYLAKGENHFSIVHNNKTYRISVIRL